MSSGLSQRSTNTITPRARPLQASTNIIHTKIPRRIDNVRARQTGKQLLEDPIRKDAGPQKNLNKLPASKSSQPPKVDENDVEGYVESEEKTTPTIEQVDENDVTSYVKNAYDPLRDVHPFDEELYQKVLKLEIADDGLPSYEMDEPFDF